MEQIFKKGDIVEAWGLRGVVIYSLPEDSHGILVHFVLSNTLDTSLAPIRSPGDMGTVICYNFMCDGKEKDWHREPTLKLIERPKKKVKKTFWMAAGDIKDTERLMTSLLYPAEEEGEVETLLNQKEFTYKIKVEVEVEEE